MNNRYGTDDTPTIDPLQGKIALLKAGISLHEWARRNKCRQPTAWRALHNQNCGPVANALRRRWARFIAEYNPQTVKGEAA
jgi:hypothetical protein